MSSQEKRGSLTSYIWTSTYIREVTSPQAFQDYVDAGRRLRRPDWTFGTFDPQRPDGQYLIFGDVISKAQIDKLAENVEEFGIEHAAHGSEKRGIVHMVGRNRTDNQKKIYRLWR